MGELGWLVSTRVAADIAALIFVKGTLLLLIVVVVGHWVRRRSAALGGLPAPGLGAGPCRACLPSDRKPGSANLGRCRAGVSCRDDPLGHGGARDTRAYA